MRRTRHTILAHPPAEGPSQPHDLSPSRKQLYFVLALVIALAVTGLATLIVPLDSWQAPAVLTGRALPAPLNNPLLWRLLIGAGLMAGLFSIFNTVATPFTFELTVDYPVFYPNRANEQRLLIIRTYLSRRAKLALEVYDELNRPVAILMGNRAQGAGEHFRLWDGRNAAGRLLPGGSYLIHATARTITNRTTSALWVRLDPSLAPTDPAPG
ncbi:MAG: hypothetical protein ACRDIB_11240 [Ardenticatenaceae bacterium]